MKLNKFKRYLQKQNIDCAVIFNKDPSFFYFLQENIENSILVIFAKRDPILFFCKLEETSKKLNIKKIFYRDPYKQLKDLLKKKRVKTIGISDSFVLVKHYKELKKIINQRNIKNIEEFLSNLIQKKTPEEIKKIKEACKITDHIFSKLIKNFNFKIEEQIRRFLLKEFAEKGVEKSFDLIVASGSNAAIPHHTKFTKLKKGFLVLDFGIKYKGYCSDMTRTIYLGKPSKKERDLYNKILLIQKQAIAQLKEDAKASSIDKFVRNQLGDYEKYFTHVLGHGIGIRIHEKPNISSKSQDRIENNMTFTIEPGIYIPNKLGIRIEDDILMKKNKPEVLTRSKKDLIIIKNFK